MTLAPPVSAGNRARTGGIRRGRELGGFELRALADGRKEFSGYAAVFNERSQGLPFVEVIDPGAFRDCLAGDPDLILCLNHNPDTVIARTSAGTLTLTEDAHGLRVSAILNPEDPDAARAITKLEDGNWRSMSFLFWDLTPPDARWVTAPDGVREAHVQRADIDFGDTSIVTYPAYGGTTAEIRSAAMRTTASDRLAARQAARSLVAEIDELGDDARDELTRAARAFSFGDQTLRVDNALEEVLGDETWDWYWWIYDIGTDFVVVRASSWDDDTPLESGWWQYPYTIDDSGVVTLGDPVEVLPRTVYDPAPEPVAGEEDDPQDRSGDTRPTMTLADARRAAGPANRGA